MTYGFIGTGNMGGALATAVAQTVGGAKVFLADRDVEKARALGEKIGGTVVTAQEIASACDVIFLGLKPQVMAQGLESLKGFLASRETPFVLVSMAAGLTVSAVQSMAGDNYPLIRIMPNMPVAVGAGMILYTPSPEVEEEQLSAFVSAMAGAGHLLLIEEKNMDAGCALSGCGPAYAFMFIEALADGGVECGLPREQALVLAAQTLLGSAKTVLETNRHPGELKDAVCSPGGATIEGVSALEQGAFRATAMNGVLAGYEKTLDLKK